MSPKNQMKSVILIISTLFGVVIMLATDTESSDDTDNWFDDEVESETLNTQLYDSTTRKDENNEQQQASTEDPFHQDPSHFIHNNIKHLIPFTSNVKRHDPVDVDVRNDDSDY